MLPTPRPTPVPTPTPRGEAGEDSETSEGGKGGNAGNTADSESGSGVGTGVIIGIVVGVIVVFGLSFVVVKKQKGQKNAGQSDGGGRSGVENQLYEQPGEVKGKGGKKDGFGFPTRGDADAQGYLEVDGSQTKR